MNQVVLVAHNIRSAHNVGSLLRTSEGLGVEKVYLTGHTPYPPTQNDARLPHISTQAAKKIQKISLGAEKYMPWQHFNDPLALLAVLARDGYRLCALEQTKGAVALDNFEPSAKTVLVIGSEVGGVASELLSTCSVHIMIPMQGRKDSLNVSVAAAIALYHLIG